MRRFKNMFKKLDTSLIFVLIFLNMSSLCLAVTVEFASRSSCIDLASGTGVLPRENLYGWNNLSIVNNTGDSYNLKNYVGSTGSILNSGSIPNDDSCAAYWTRQNVSGTVNSLAWYRGGIYFTGNTVITNPFPICKDIDSGSIYTTLTLSSDLYVGPDTNIGSLMFRGTDTTNGLTTTQSLIMTGDVKLKGAGSTWTLMGDMIINGGGYSFDFNGQGVNLSPIWGNVNKANVIFKNITLKNFVGLSTYVNNRYVTYTYCRYDFENVIFEMQANSDFKYGGSKYPDMISFSGNVLFKGNGYTISFDEPIRVEKDAVLRFDKGTTVKFANSASVTMADATSSIYFDGCTILLDSSLTSTVALSKGLICFDNKVNLNSGGGLKVLSVSSTATARALAGARVVVGSNAHLRVDN